MLNENIVGCLIKLSRESHDIDEVEKLVKKSLEETELTSDLIVYSQRTAFVYGDDDGEKKHVPIEEFLTDILEEKGRSLGSHF